MVAAQLVIGAGIGWAQVKTFESLGLRLDVERDTDESARVRRGTSARFASEINLDGSVLETGPRQDGSIDPSPT